MEVRRADFLLVSDHRLFRECLAARLAAEGVTRVAEADDLGAAAETLERTSAEVVIADLPPPSDRLCEELRRLVERFAGLRVVVLGGDEDEEAYLRWVESGAVGYLLQDSSLHELREAVERARRAELHCPPGVGYRLFSRLGDLAAERRRRERVEALSLSPRELEVLAMVAERSSNRQIAERLCLSVYTVKNHVHRILAKLEVRQRQAAVAKAYEHGWLRERRSERAQAV